MYDSGQDVVAFIQSGGWWLISFAVVVVVLNAGLIGLALYSWMAALFGNHHAPDPF